jgi:hypothetical protein
MGEYSHIVAVVKSHSPHLQLCDRTSTLLFVQKPKMLVANGWG